MKTIFFHDTKFIYDGKDYYTRGPLNQEKFNEYKEYFGEITVVCRGKGIENNKQFIKEKNKINDVNFIVVNSKYKGIRKKIKEQVQKSDFAIVRLPSFIGVTAIHYLNKYKKEYIVEMVGCPFDALWNYGNIKGKLVAPIMTVLNKYYVRKAKNVLYVSNEFLQKRYPNKNYNIECSDVNIEEISKSVLENRLNKIETKKKEEPIKIGLIGSLDIKYKGHNLAIKAIDLLKEQYNIELHFLGAGNPDNWSNTIEKYGMKEVVHFDGTLPSGQPVYEWMDNIDIYLIPSLQEGMPRALIEAMSRACPAIGTKVGGIPEILPDKMLIKKKSDKELAKLVLELIQNKKLQEKCAIENFEKAKEFEKEKLMIKRKGFYKKVLSEMGDKQV